ncbi:hypothetical protein DL771_008161 [Monosporascus sp. 5C6A]|nr:hypothetical protein DL771_008161 [Monosporascus sp. 5C6A]
MDPTALPALGIVRRYSTKLHEEEPQDTLAQALVSHVDWSVSQEYRGRRLFSESANAALGIYNDVSPPQNVFLDMSPLQEVSERLEKSWKQVIKLANKKESKNNNGAPSVPDKPDINVVIGMLHEARKKMKKKETTKSSSFAALVEAAATYESTASKIEDCLDQISDEVHHLSRVVEDREHNNYLKVQVAKFYCVLFEFLVSVLTEWYKCAPKRILNSFTATLESTCDDAISKMKRYRGNAKDEVDAEVKAESMSLLRNLGMLVEAGHVGKVYNMSKSRNPSPFINAHMTSQSLPQPPEPAKIEQTVMATRGRSSSSNSTSRNTNLSGKLISENNGFKTSDADTSNKIISDEDSDDLTPTWDASTIQEAALPLQSYVQKDRIAKLAERSKHLSTNREVYARLMKWVTSPDTNGFLMEGPPHVPEPSQSKLSSVYMFVAVQKLQIPVVGYFCVYDGRQRFNRAEELLKLVYSLIYQVSLILPNNIRPGGDLDADLSSSRFSCLTGTVESIDGAIDLLGDLLAVGPPLFFVILDGLQLLERDSDPQKLRDCFRKFIGVINDTLTANTVDRRRIVKVLFSTDGACLELRPYIRSGLITPVVYEKEARHEPMRLRAPDIAGLKEHPK